MDHEERYICGQQKELYEYAHSHKADIYSFSDSFMNSRFCNDSLDKPYSVDQYADIMNWLEFLEMENCVVTPDPIKSDEVSFNAAGWIGYVYRQLHFVTGLQSKELAKRVPVRRLALSYPGLHTVDEDMAIDIIRNDFELKKITGFRCGDCLRSDMDPGCLGSMPDDSAIQGEKLCKGFLERK